MLEKEEHAGRAIERIDPRVRRTRQMLQAAMSALLKEKDFADINVQDITERADLNRATFYKHFMDKYDLLNTIVRERFQTRLDEALPEQPKLSVENVGILIRTAYDYIAGFHGSCLVARVRGEHGLMMQQVQHQIYDVLLHWLQQCRAHSGQQTAKAPELTALLTSWAIFGPIMQTAWGTTKVPKQALIEQVTALVHSALEDYLVAV